MSRSLGPCVWVALLLGVTGCTRSLLTTRPVEKVSLRRAALRCLETAIRYEYNTVVRVEAVEAMALSGCAEVLPWIRSALRDRQPAVRFAACVAVGRLNDSIAEQGIERCLDDEDRSVQAGAVFAMHCLGRTERSGRLATFLLHDEDVTVRRNAAMLLGLLDEQGATKILARAMKDGDHGVRQQALEGMARLGVREARQELAFMTSAGIGSEEVFAIDALAGTDDRRFVDTLRYKLATATHIETRLAAARGLGRLGYDDGFDVAVRALRTSRVRRNDPGDPPADQLLRIRQMAASALGAIGRVDALDALENLMERSNDPRVEVSAARAILRILPPDSRGASPFAPAGIGGE